MIKIVYTLLIITKCCKILSFIIVIKLQLCTYNITVFVTYLDASKVFDILDHWLLFIKLIKRSVLLFIVRLLIVWYSLQRMHMRWGNTFSTSFCESNGVQQGGIISLVLFNVYMDDRSCALNRSNIGGRIGGEIVNHFKILTFV